MTSDRRGPGTARGAPRFALRLGPTSLLLAARALRDFADGFAAVLLPVYLRTLGFSALEVGVLATAALLGSACLTFGAGLLGARYDHRRLLLAAAALMIATGIAFATLRDYGLLLLVAFAGTLNPSAGSASVFVPMEHAALSGAVADRERTRLFARYSLIGALAGALGALTAAAPELLVARGAERLGAIEAMFVLYAALGLLSAALYARLPPSCPRAPERRAAAAALGPAARPIVLRLAALFSLDAFAGGFVVQSLLALWLLERFELSLSAAGAFFFCAGVLSALSFPAAAWLSRRIGLVNTMVFTHLPSSIALLVAALAPDLSLVLALLLARAALSQMDVPARASYVMALVDERERAAAASVTAVPRSLAAAASPALAGALLASTSFAWPLIVCGSLKILYDLLLWRQFRALKPPEELGPAAPQ